MKPRQMEKTTYIRPNPSANHWYLECQPMVGGPLSPRANSLTPFNTSCLYIDRYTLPALELRLSYRRLSRA